MSEFDHSAAAMNAAGIADAFRLLQQSDREGNARRTAISGSCGGWIGVAKIIGQAGEVMELYRCSQGLDSDWGDDLPHQYDVWYAIASALWFGEFGSEGVEIVGICRALESPSST